MEWLEIILCIYLGLGVLANLVTIVKDGFGNKYNFWEKVCIFTLLIIINPLIWIEIYKNCKTVHKSRAKFSRRL